MLEINLVDSDNESEVKAFNCFDYFDIKEADGKSKYTSTCRIVSCKRVLSGRLKGNMLRHLKTVHDLGHGADVLDNKIKRKIKLHMSPNNIYTACIEMCTVNGRPLAALNDSGFRRILQPILDAFLCAGIKIDLRDENIHEYLSVYAHRIKQEIINEIEGKMVSIKMDIVKRHRRCILGINMQYIKNDEIVIRTLDMVETKSSHTGEYICSLLIQVLSDYGISLPQVYSITTDNGKNIVKSVDMFCEYAQSNHLILQDLDDILQTTLEYEMDDGSGDDENLEQEIFNSITRVFPEKSVTKGLPCASHTIQIIVNELLGPKSKTVFSELVHKFRTVSYMMNKPNVVNLIKSKGLPLAKRDNDTRWSSYFYMLKRMQELRTFYEENELFILGRKFMNRKLCASDWEDLESMMPSLCFFERITNRLQAEKLSPSDFFASWEELKLELCDLDSELATHLRSRMENREGDLYNDLIFGGVFLDPRYNILLTDGK